MANKKENDSIKNTVIKTARYGSLSPNFPRDSGSISIRYGSPRQKTDVDFFEIKEKPHEVETIARYGCPPPEISNKPSKLKRIIEILKEKEE